VEIIVARHAGFCFGVKRALDLVRDAAEASPAPIQTLGPLIHNPQVVSRLEQEGVRSISDLSQAESGTVVIPSHGAGADVAERAQDAGLAVLDATCPLVADAQAHARRLAEEGYRVVILGDPGHPEVVGLARHAGPQAIVVENAEAARSLPRMGRVGLVCQTTQTLDRLRAVAAVLLEKASELRVLNTICGATAQRQQSALDVAQNVDVVVVVGGRNSANTNRLTQICTDAGVETHHVETAEELDPAWFRGPSGHPEGGPQGRLKGGKERVGVTAGASTPQWLIDGVVEALRRIAAES
jgi:4-hydroxy-3-methylbut-2-enyl diphosphate reductase